MLRIFILFLLSVPLFCQYSRDDKELAQTTFSREFNKSIIRQYLQSDDPEKVKAGLLSVSHSEDTTFVDEITSINFQQYGDYISFALGQIGPCNKSTQFLLASLNSKGNFSREILDALGKTGSKEALNNILNQYSISPYIFNGVSIALVNFNSRGIKQADNRELQLLQSEINHQTGQRLADALYALYRIGPDSTITGDLLKIINYQARNEDDIFKLQYILGSFRKLKYFPGIPSLLEKLLSHPDWRIRTEAVKCACYYNYTKVEELNKFITLLKDSSPGVARQTAISMSTLTLRYPLTNKLKQIMEDALLEPSFYTTNVVGELFVSYTKLYKSDLFKLIKRYEGTVGFKFICEALKVNTENPKNNYDYLKSKFYSTRNSERLNATDALLPLQTDLIDDSDYGKTLLDNFGSSFPPVITLTAESLDSLFIKQYKDELKNKINTFIQKQMDNKEFSEAIVSSVKLAKRIDEVFYSTKLNSLKYSKNTFVKNFAYSELKLPSEKQANIFDYIWENAFNFSSAKIITGKGEFTIKFLPKYAPLSVGNFCSLALEKYFDGIIFHRVVPDFVIQTGDKTGTGWGGPGYEIVSEFSPLPFDKGYVGMASSGKDSEGSQWFVMHSSYPHLTAKYSNFGKVISGMNIVNIIDEGDKIIRIELED